MKKLLLFVMLTVFCSALHGMEITSAVMGDAPNFAQTSNGNFSVVSREYGRGAKAGALIEFFYPFFARDHLHEAYNGIFYQGRLSWLHDLKLVSQSMVEDTGIVLSEFSTPDGRLSVKTWDVALHGEDVLVRHFEITNTSKERLEDLRIFFYEHLTVNYLGTGDYLYYDRDTQSFRHGGKDVVFHVASDRPIHQWEVGRVGSNWFTNYDARLDAADGVLRKNRRERGLLDLGVNGAMGHNVPFINSGETIAINYFLSVGTSDAESWKQMLRAKAKTWPDILAGEKAHWQAWLAKGKRIASQDPRVQKAYRRALITLKQDAARNGAIIAAPTLLSPVYGLVWPRDGSFISLAFLEAGYREEAAKFLDFILARQKPNGGWAVNFFCDGSRHLWDFGDRKNEHDQVGMVIWIAYEYFRHTNDAEWLKARWPALKNAAEFLLRFMTPKGLIGPCRDLWELDTDKTWTFTNAAVYAGLKSASEIAGFAGDPDAKSRYLKAAEVVKKAIATQLWSEPDGCFVRGVHPETGRPDRKLEAANMALSYPFDVFEAGDPRMKRMARAIMQTLASPRKGIRRYTDDPYYGGHPWPVTTAWMALYFGRIGEMALAREMHAVVTDYVWETPSLLLGEQFDETKKRWVSAVPLTWSAAKYVLATLELFSR